MPSAVPPARTPVAVPPPLPVGSSATISVGSKTHKHQLMQEKLEVAKMCRAAACKPNNTNVPPAPEAMTATPTSTSSTAWH